MGLVRHRVEIHVAGSRVLAGIAACICLGAAGPSPRAACAAPLTVGGGFDYYSGPSDQITRTALAIASVGFGSSGSASIAGLRYDDSNAGVGAGVTIALGLPVGPTSALKLLGSEFAGSDFRAWRVKAGPQASLPRQRPAPTHWPLRSRPIPPGAQSPRVLHLVWKARKGLLA